MLKLTNLITHILLLFFACFIILIFFIASNTRKVLLCCAWLICVQDRKFILSSLISDSVTPIAITKKVLTKQQFAHLSMQSFFLFHFSRPFPLSKTKVSEKGKKISLMAFRFYLNLFSFSGSDF